MKNILLSLVMSLFGVTGMYAQEEQVATLVSGSTSTQFYGTEALVDAYAAAKNGDVITLSGGVFTAVNIEKAITLRGVGMRPTNNNAATITRLGAFTVNVPEDAETELTLEDLKIEGNVTINGKDLVPVNLYRCYMADSDGSVYNSKCSLACNGVYAKLIHCIMCTVTSTSSKVYSQSCYMESPKGSNYIMDNCNIFWAYSGLENSIIKNCIFSARSDYHLSNTNSVTYCICNGSGTVFSNTNNSTNKYTAKFTWTSATYKQTFELPEDIATTYLGDDGTQVGMLGGTNPFTDKSSNPQVKKLAVKSSTENGVLKIKIDVE